MTTISDLEDTGIRRRDDGSIDTDFYARRAMMARAQAFAAQRTEFVGRFARLIAALLAWGGKARPGFHGPAH